MTVTALGPPVTSERLISLFLHIRALSLAFNLGCPAWPDVGDLARRSPERSRPAHDDLRVPTKISKAKAAAVAFSMAWLDGPVEDRAADRGALDRLAAIRHDVGRNRKTGTAKGAGKKPTG